MNIISFLQEIIKEVQAPLIKGSLLLLIFLNLSACAKTAKKTIEVSEQQIVYKEITALEVPKNAIELSPEKGMWYYQGIPFNGYAVTYYANEKIAERIGYFNGKKEGVAKKWFKNGVPQKISHYRENRLHGVETIWWSTGALAAKFTYNHGFKDGTQQRWYTNGQLSRKTNYTKGKEEGIQQAWLENGKIYVNYEAKNGRSFGLRKAKLCFALENEIVQR
jgi:antitoxin component YwqK of YwqJK toxin-antitoxin module